MADLQSDPSEELAWNQRALEAADSVTDERVKQHHAYLAIRGFSPSLHLNLAAGHHKLGAADRASAHLSEARRRLDALHDDDYGRAIRSAIDRLATQLTHPGSRD
ncbi:MAG TPA: hypothetical protein VFH77_12865 [Streptomyces sp.]|nr:hypothetical protein [Streptomyces sp.]